MKLNATQVSGLKPGSKKYKVSDGGGLYLEINPTGSKLWRFRYRFNGKQKLLALGKYPDVNLKKAREDHQEARKLLANGIDPAEAKKQKKQIQSNTFQAVAQSWWEANKAIWSEDHANTIKSRLEGNIFPYIGNTPVAELTTRDILQALRKVESRGAVETAHRIGRVISQIFTYAIACGLADTNPAQEITKALKSIPKRNLPGITEPAQIKELLNAMDSFQGSFIVYCALRFLPLVFVRPGELRKAEWQEIDFENSLWIIPGHRMKKKRDHLVPLSRQALEILKEIYPLTSKSQYVFPAVRSFQRPMSENTLNVALRRLGYTQDQLCAHGFRTMASSRLHELGWNSQIIEFQLAHVDQNKTRAAYNRAEFLEERAKMMQAWSDYLDGLKSGAPVLPFQQNNT